MVDGMTGETVMIVLVPFVVKVVTTMTTTATMVITTTAAIAMVVVVLTVMLMTMIVLVPGLTAMMMKRGGSLRIGGPPPSSCGHISSSCGRCSASGLLAVSMASYPSPSTDARLLRDQHHHVGVLFVCSCLIACPVCILYVSVVVWVICEEGEVSSCSCYPTTTSLLCALLPAARRSSRTPQLTMGEHRTPPTDHVL